MEDWDAGILAWLECSFSWQVLRVVCGEDCMNYRVETGVTHSFPGYIPFEWDKEDVGKNQL